MTTNAILNGMVKPGTSDSVYAGVIGCLNRLNTIPAAGREVIGDDAEFHALRVPLGDAAHAQRRVLMHSDAISRGWHLLHIIDYA